MNKYFFIFFIFVHGLNAMEQESDKKEDNKKTIVLYASGYGEIGQYHNSFIVFDEKKVMSVGLSNCNQTIGGSDFYGGCTVGELVSKLHIYHHDFESTKGCPIVLIGRSCGAGIVLNSLKALVRNDKERFEKIFDSKEYVERFNFENIIKSINKGGLILNVPLLHLRKANSIIISSDMMAMVTTSVISKIGMYCLKKIFSINQHIGFMDTKFSLFGFGMGVYFLLRNWLKENYMNVIIYKILPIISKFDPKHEAPIEGIEKLKEIFTCPILLHFCENDGVLVDPDDDTIKLYENLQGDRTHIIITEEDDHNTQSEATLLKFQEFQKRYLDKEPKKDELKDVLEDTQPTIDELRNRINSKNKSILFKNRVFIATTIFGMPLIFVAIEGLVWILMKMYFLI